jgi:uncharacterized protein YecE (DUF72 family)
VGEQVNLFELGPSAVAAAQPNPEHVALAQALPAGIYLGAMSWTYPGWIGSVYGAAVPARQLAEGGLSAYAKHPLLRAVEIDRSYYGPLSAELFQTFAAQVPEDFRFLVKAHAECTLQRFPEHTRYGARRGAANARFLDAAYASEAVIAPAQAGLREKLGGVLFQFSPQALGDPRAFAEQLRSFLQALPRGLRYAVELRSPQLLTRGYARALEQSGAVHCHNLWTAMPGLIEQARYLPAVTRRPLVIRWLLRPNDRYEDASARYQPFHRLADADLQARTAIAELAARAHRHGVPVFVFVDNKAEGCAPESIALLARAIVGALESASAAPAG